MENRDWEKIAMKNKKIIIIVISIILILAISVGIGITIYFNNKPKNKPEDVLQTFASYINDKKYEDMYSLLSSKSKANISEEDFIKRNKNIYEGIEAENFSVDIQSIENENKLAKVKYKNSMDTMSGHVDFTNTVTLELNEEKEYKIDWTSNLIFPKLNTEDKVRVKTIEAKRGSILDRNGEYLATNGVASKIGLAPANKVGVVDPDYRGEFMIALHNHSDLEQTIEPAERVAQLVITPFITADFNLTDSLSETVRGEGGFGSTGTK